MDKNKIKWKCRRGVLELDTLLSDFWQVSINALSENDLDDFVLLLAEEDPNLLDWLVYNVSPPKKYLSIVALIKANQF